MIQVNLSRKFPPFPSLGLEEDRLRVLLGNAIKEYSDALLATKAEAQQHHTVYLRDEHNNITSKAIPNFPSYQRTKWDKSVRKYFQSGSNTRNLLDYIWNRGGMPYSFTGPDQQRETWEDYVCYDLLHKPISNTLDRLAHNQAIKSGSANAPEVSAEDLKRIQEELILLLCHDQYRFIVTCPLLGITGDSGTVWQLSNDISLRIYTEEQKIEYLSRNHHFISSLSDRESVLSIIRGNGVLEITCSISKEERRVGRNLKLPREIIREQLEDKIDVVKLALALAFDVDIPLKEDIIICEDIFGNPPFSKFLTFRRDESTDGVFIPCEMTSDKEAVVNNLVGDLSTIQMKCEDISKAIWFWGRSCLRSSPRDILLEATIGLENLLVSGAGDSSYRFRLHGSAILSNSSDEALINSINLKKIYEHRSKSVHGNSGEKLERKHAHLARKYLGKAIEAIAKLYISGAINPSQKIAKQIEDKVVERAVIGHGN
jgi:hypothetical protein